MVDRVVGRGEGGGYVDIVFLFLPMATLGRLLRGGAERVWAFLSATMSS